MTVRSSRRTALLGWSLALAMTAGSVPATASADLVDVIVRPATTIEAASHDVTRLGGTITHTLPAIGMLNASISTDRLAELRADSDIAGVTVDGNVTFASRDKSAPEDEAASPVNVAARTVGAAKYRAKGFDGEGIDIALIDTGVAPIGGLAGQRVDGIDLSFDAGNPERAGRDLYGHGTHLAGIMTANGRDLQGIAPGSRVVDVRVGDGNGACDVSQVIAGIDWVIQNAKTDGRNIRIITLAFGTDATQDYVVDPLSYAVEAAWRAGIVVVVSAGNGGTSAGSLANPATNPRILAVGASNTMGTADRSDDRMADFSQRGSRSRTPDVVAPGTSLLSLMPVGSVLDKQYPEARRGDLFLGSGTSQAAAVASGAIALLLQNKPYLTPDEVKAALSAGATSLVDGSAWDGAGLLDVVTSRGHIKTGVTQNFTASNGSGSLEAARGSHHVDLVMDDGSIVTLEGEIDFTGSSWNGEAWAGSSWNGSSWNGSSWNGSSWNGSSWNGSSWNGSSWNGSSWNGSSWNSAIWGQ